ncbi:MAG: helix-turn-helix domain-containing protein [Candidatus Margulisbacteria bacterium]|jgi:transcriptional regulator with XRE-family HTH domain|nr:helix-turn-helix domain-containing protein [Candidatus Margulisiibacteriota bacterium]
MAESRDIRKTIGDKLKTVRNKLNYSLQQMATECGLDYAHYCLIEKGKRYVRLDILQRISDNLSVSMDFWFRNDDVTLVPHSTKKIYEAINSLGKDKLEFLYGLLTAYSKIK